MEIKPRIVSILSGLYQAVKTALSYYTFRKENMASIEGGSVGGISGGVGGGVALGGGPTLGPSIGGGFEAGGIGAPAGVNTLSVFGPKLDVPSSLAGINEGPVGAGFLRNTEAYVFNPDPVDLTGGLRIHAPRGFLDPEPLDTQAVLNEANHWLGVKEPSFGPTAEQDAVAAVESMFAKPQTEIPKLEKTFVDEPGIKSEPLSIEAILNEANQILGISEPKTFTDQTADQIALKEVRAKLDEFKAIPIPIFTSETVISPQPIKEEGVLPNPITKTLTEGAISPNLGTDITNALQPETKAIYKQAVSVPTLHPQEQAEPKAEVEEEEVQRAEDEDTDIRDEEKVAVIKTSHSVDKKAVSKRYGAIIKAAEEAKAAKEAKGEPGPILGREIKEYISNLQDLSFRGGELNEVDPKGNLPDGTWEANLADLESKIFSSLEEVEKQAPEIISQNNPFEKGEGQEVTDKTIATGYKYAPTKAHKARQIALIRTKKRQILAGKEGQKAVRIIPAEEVKSNIEGRVEDYHPELAKALLAKAA